MRGWWSAGLGIAVAVTALALGQNRPGVGFLLSVQTSLKVSRFRLLVPRHKVISVPRTSQRIRHFSPANQKITLSATNFFSKNVDSS